MIEYNVINNSWIVAYTFKYVQTQSLPNHGTVKPRGTCPTSRDLTSAVTIVNSLTGIGPYGQFFKHKIEQIQDYLLVFIALMKTDKESKFLVF